MLEIDGLRMQYGPDIVIDDLTWTAGGDGALVTALLGPSGCGKSTLIRAVAGLEQPSAGRILLDGRDLSRLQPHRRDFGVVFQDGQLFAGRTVAANIGYGLRMRRRPRREIASRVEEMLELVGLAGFGRRQVGELSGGQAQRVALARALAPAPRLLLLDEPLAALDRRLRDRLAIEIADIVRATGTPTIVVTHDHTEAALMADEVAVMRAGDMVATATPGRLWRRTADDWTARFLGVTTIVDAQLEGTRATGVLGTVDIGETAEAVADGPIRLGLRAESLVAVEVDDSAREAGDAELSGTVVRVTALPSGPRVVVDTRIGHVWAVADGGAAHLDARVVLEPVADRIAIIAGEVP